MRREAEEDYNFRQIRGLKCVLGLKISSLLSDFPTKNRKEMFILAFSLFVGDS